MDSPRDMRGESRRLLGRYEDAGLEQVVFVAQDEGLGLDRREEWADARRDDGLLMRVDLGDDVLGESPVMQHASDSDPRRRR